MRATTLTISQLAAHVGVTVRAVRHYHARGLLREPRRDASGYRRYDAQAVVDLIRIRTLAEAGVPLSQVRRLLEAEPAEFSAAVGEIDRGLDAKIRQMEWRRRRLGELAEGERLFLPAEIVDVLDRLRALGVSERTMRMERDSWILATALIPAQVGTWVAEKRAAFDDPDFRRLYLACDQARDWDAADPRLDELKHALEEWTFRRQERGRPEAGSRVNELVAIGLLVAQFADASPAWQRLSSARATADEPTPPRERTLSAAAALQVQANAGPKKPTDVGR